MAAYSLADRFRPPPDCRRVGNLDPGAYNLLPYIRKPRENKAPFLSRVPRKTLATAQVYTHAIYNAEKPHHILGASALNAKCPRFKHERSLHPPEEEEYRCRCELDPCACPVEPEEVEEVTCQAKVPRKLYKGHVPFSWLGSSKSMPSRGHQGYTLFPDGTRKAIPPPFADTSLGPAFYDTRLNEGTAFFRGCKWSQWTAKRSDTRPPEKRPGPADYQHERVPTLDEICMDEFKFDKRHHTMQLRYLEMMQLRALLHGNPGPADYHPKTPRGDCVELLGDKAPRFPDVSTEVRRGPADYTISGPGLDYKANSNVKRAADAPFGVRAERFRGKADGLPGPGQYSPRIKKTIRSPNCPGPAFGSSAPRMKPDQYDSESDEDEPPVPCPCPPNPCVLPTSGFKSKTKRFKPLVKRLDCPSPADMPLPMTKLDKRHPDVQALAPFQCSEGRFQPWHNWIPVHGADVTPGPGVYDLTSKPFCVGGKWTLSSAPRFPRPKYSGPPPNAYNVDQGIETVRHTYNKRLLKNLNKKDKFKWKCPFKEPKSIRSREEYLIAKSIDQLDPDNDGTRKFKPKIKKSNNQGDKPRVPGEKLLLKHFLYDHHFIQYY